MKRKKVMVIDDDKEFLSELKEMLDKAGYQVFDVSDPEKALTTVNTVKPDVILMDLKIGSKSGFQLATELKSRIDTMDIPVIAISGYYRREEDATLRKAVGIIEQLDKPINPPDLISMIERISPREERA